MLWVLMAGLKICRPCLPVIGAAQCLSDVLVNVVLDIL